MKPSQSFIHRSLYSFVGNILDHLLRFENLFSNNACLLEAPPAIDSTVTKYVIYSGYDKYEIDNGTKEILNTASEKGYRVFIVINSNEVDHFITSKYLSQFIVVLRRNRGFDLAAFRDITRLLPQETSEVILINSSAYWNPSHFWRLIESLKFESVTKNPIYVGPESLQKGLHYQSFFFYARDVESVNKLKIIFSHMRNWRSKRATVNFGERRIPFFAKSVGAHLISTFSYSSVLNEYKSTKDFRLDSESIDRLIQKNVKLNPSQHFWKELVSLGAPFLKRNLITSNPAKLRDLPDSRLWNQC